MSLPTYEDFMLPLRRLLGDKQEHSMKEIKDQLAQECGLTEEQRRELLPSGKQAIFDNRIGWARTYMKKAGLLDQPRRAVVRITTRELDVLHSGVQRIDCDFMSQYPEFQAWRTGTEPEVDPSPPDNDDKRTPEEILEHAYVRIREGLAEELLSKIKSCSSAFFERLVVELLVKMGYGGSLRDAGQGHGAIGRRRYRWHY